MRRGLVAAAVAVGVVSAGSVASADPGWTLTGTQGNPGGMLFLEGGQPELGPSDPVGCHINGTSVKPFATSGVTTLTYGPFAGKYMTYSGSMTLGPQTTSTVDNYDPLYGFPAQYGALTSFSGTFEIKTTPFGSPIVTGTFDGLLPPIGGAAFGNFGSCYGVPGSPSGGLGWTIPIESGALIAVDAHVHYTAVKDGETITGKMFFRQRQTCSMMPAPYFQQCGYTGGDVNFYDTAETPTPPDTTPPTITATDGLHFAQGSSATPNFSCADETGGSGLATCVGSVTALDTATAGTKTYTVNATDNAGNPATRTITYIVDAPPPPVLHYTTAGFQQPIDMGMVNSAKAGQAIPAKWQLRDANGALVSDPASFVNATSSAISCVNGAPTDAIEEYTTGASGLQYNAGTWQFNWATPKSYAGTCRLFSVNLADGSHIVAKFQFK